MTLFFFFTADLYSDQNLIKPVTKAFIAFHTGLVLDWISSLAFADLLKRHKKLLVNAEYIYD